MDNSKDGETGTVMASKVYEEKHTVEQGGKFVQTQNFQNDVEKDTNKPDVSEMVLHNDGKQEKKDTKQAIIKSNNSKYKKGKGTASASNACVLL